MNEHFKNINNQSGQMVILVLLVLVIALTVGLSLIARSTQNIRLSTNTELSNRAYSAAEAGIEEALRAGTPTGTAAPATVGSGTSQATYMTTFTTQGNSAQTFAYPNPVEVNESVQTWLFNYDYFKNNNGTLPPTTGSNYFNSCSGCDDLTVYWGSGTSATLPTPSSTTPALEVSLIYVNASTGNFEIEKFAVDPNTTRGNNFDQVDVGAAPYTLTNTTQGSKRYYYKKTLTLSPFSSRRYLLMRAKLLYNTDAKHEIAVDPNGSVLPAQGQVIESQGTAGDVVLKIRVYQSYPSLPGLFDFVLFNGSAQPLTK